METSIKVCLIAETKTENIFTCGNKVQHFALLGRKKHISIAWETVADICALVESNQMINFYLGKQKLHFPLLGITKKIYNAVICSK